MRLFPPMLTLLLFAAASSAYPADVAYTTLSANPSNRYDWSSGYTVAGNATSLPNAYTSAAGFWVTGTAYNLSELRLPLGLVAPAAGPASFTVTLRAADIVFGLPGSILETWSGVPAFGSFGLCCDLVTLSSAGTQLDPGQVYWVVAEGSPLMFGAWNWSNSGLPGYVAQATDSGPFQYRFESVLALEVTATPVPEPPGALGAGVVSAGIAVLLGRKRRES